MRLSARGSFDRTVDRKIGITFVRCSSLHRVTSFSETSPFCLSQLRCIKG